MRTFSLVSTALVFALVGACAPKEETVVSPEETSQAAPEPMAGGATTGAFAVAVTATLAPQAGASGSGTVTFTPTANGVEVTVTVTGLTPGEHGIHLHEGNECVGDFTSAGGHFNPTAAPHGAPDGTGVHAGDFANVEVGADGTGTRTWTSTSLTLDAGPSSAIGHAFIVHEQADDLTTQPTGNSGGRILCGVVTAGGDTAEGAAGTMDTGAVATGAI